MGYRIGIAGPPNSGKSFSRKTMRDGENVFIIMPSWKAPYLKTSDKKPVTRLYITSKEIHTQEEVMKNMGVSTELGLLRKLNANVPAGRLTREYVKGNIAWVKNLSDLNVYFDFINKHMSWIHTIILPDFTHFISEIISKPEFIERKHGGDAYQRFWELGGDALQKFILKSDTTRQNLITVMEYHTEIDSKGNMRIFVPAGQMLSEKFLPESYYDILLVTAIIPEENGEVTPDSYKFITRRTADASIARSMDIFDSTYIPNDLQLVLDRVRTEIGIPIQ